MPTRLARPLTVTVLVLVACASAAEPRPLPPHPRLLLNREGIEQLRQKIQHEPWNKVWAKFVAEMDRELKHKIELPPRGGNWSHNYVCPTHGARLKQGRQSARGNGSTNARSGRTSCAATPARPRSTSTATASAAAHGGLRPSGSRPGRRLSSYRQDALCRARSGDPPGVRGEVSHVHHARQPGAGGQAEWRPRGLATVDGSQLAGPDGARRRSDLGHVGAIPTRRAGAKALPAGHRGDDSQPLHQAGDPQHPVPPQQRRGAGRFPAWATSN